MMQIPRTCRILSLWLNRLATDRVRRERRARRHEDDGAAERPLVIAARRGNALVLSAVDETAEALGLAPELPLADARARYPALDVAPADEDADRALLACLALWCGRYTPLVALDPPDGVLMDVAGCAHLFGGEAALIEDLLARIKVQGFSARTALADTAAAAWALTRYGNGSRATILQPGAPARALADLPVAGLRLDGRIVAQLRHLGLIRIGQLLTTPRAPLARRFGRVLIERLDALEGQYGEAFSWLQPVSPVSAERRLAEPLVQQEAVETIIAALAQQIGAELERRLEGARLFCLTLFRVDGAVRRIEVGAAWPLHDPERIAELFHERLTRIADPLDAGFGYDVIRLGADALERLSATQPRLDEADAGVDEIDLVRLVDRLSARLGPKTVVRLASRASHLPERDARQVAWTARVMDGEDVRPVVLTFASASPPLRPLRLYARPEPVQVTALTPDGPPARMTWRRMSVRLVRAEGPERVAPEWWRDHKVSPLRRLTRDYYRLEDEVGRRYWVFRAGLYERETDSPAWFLHGLFA